MSQLNLKQLLGTDDVAVLVDKLNYNFNQVILNGGGPQGKQGLIGGPGFPGLQGERGLTGATGPDGTYWFVAQMSPLLYTFGGTYSEVPREGDLYIDAEPTFLDIYQLTATGGSATYWNLIDTLQAPTGALQLIYDQVLLGATSTSIANDPLLAGKFIIGTPEALGASAYILDYPLNPTKRITLLSTGFPFADSLTTLASRTGNQIRLIGIDESLLDLPTRAMHGGGIAHSFLYEPHLGTTAQMYRIQNADLGQAGLGTKHFSINFNNGYGTLLYGSTANNISMGGNEYEILKARLSVNNTLAVGTPSFYTSATVFPGGLIQGSLLVGDTTTNAWGLLTGGRVVGSFSEGGYSSTLWVDSQLHPGNSNAGSNLMFSTDVSPSLSNPSTWNWEMSAYDNVVNPDKNNLKLTASISGINGGMFGTPYTAMYKSLTASAANVNVRPAFGIGNLGGNKPVSWLEVGPTSGTIGIGYVGATYMTSYMSFNQHRNVFGLWNRRGDGTNNAAVTIWNSISGGLGISLTPRSSGADAFNESQTSLYNNTREHITVNGYKTFSEIRNAATDVEINSGLKYTFWADYGALGPDNGTTFVDSTGRRRMVGVFGDGPAYLNKGGTPVICTVNGLTQSGSVSRILPQYTFWNALGEGLYIDKSSTVNSSFGYSVGIATQGDSGLVIANGLDFWKRGPWVGVYNSAPYGRFHIGASAGGPGLLINDYTPIVGQMPAQEILYNAYRNVASGNLERIQGSNSAWQTTNKGYGQIAFFDENQSFNSRRAGTSIAISAGWGGATGFPVEVTALSGQLPSLIISPPAFTNDSGGAFPTGYNSNYFPQVRIGMLAEEDGSETLKRGTLSIPAQYRNNLHDVEDYYNIGLYSTGMVPVAGISVGTSTDADFHPSIGNRRLSINFLNENLGAVYNNDVSVLEANYQSSTLFNVPGDMTKRVLSTGPGFRTALAGNSSPIPPFSGGAVLPRLFVNGYTGGGGIVNPISAWFTDNVYVDHTGNQFGGLWIKNDTATTTPWGISYKTTTNTTYGGLRTGLSFHKPGALNYGLWIDDKGGVVIGGDSGGMDPQDKDFAGNFYYASIVGAPFPGWNNLGVPGPVWQTGNGGGAGGYGSPQMFWYGGVPSPGGDAGSNLGGVTLSVRTGIRTDKIFVTSDKRLKKDFNEIENGLAVVDALKPVRFRWKKDSTPSAGFVAQDVGPLIPEAVLVFGEGESETMTVDYNVIIPYLTSAIQTLKKEAEIKHTRIVELEDRLSKIEKFLNL